MSVASWYDSGTRLNGGAAAVAPPPPAATEEDLAPAAGEDLQLKIKQAEAEMQALEARVRAAKTMNAEPSGSTTEGWQLRVAAAQERAQVVKADQDATTAAMVVGSVGLLLLPGVLLLPFDNLLVDLVLSTIVGAGGMGYLAGFREGPVGDAARKLGRTVSSAAGQLAEKLPLDALEGGMS